MPSEEDHGISNFGAPVGCNIGASGARELAPITIWRQQYTSEAFQRLTAEHGVTFTISRSGNVWDKAANDWHVVVR